MSKILFYVLFILELKLLFLTVVNIFMIFLYKFYYMDVNMLFSYCKDKVFFGVYLNFHCKKLIFFTFSYNCKVTSGLNLAVCLTSFTFVTKATETM